MLAWAGPLIMEHPVMLSASERHHVIDALDKLINARKKAVELIVERLDSKLDANTEAVLDAALDAAIRETKKAGSKLERWHPDSESLPIREWTTFKELSIVAAAAREKTADMRDEQVTAWKQATIARVRERAARIDDEMRRVRGQLPGSAPGNDLVLVPGGFQYRQKTYDLTGRPLQMLTAILNTNHHRCTRDELRRLIGVDDTAVTFPEQVVLDTAKELRAALRKAVEDAGLDCNNPLPSTGRGADLTYRLAMP
jgi:hypothetical protein